MEKNRICWIDTAKGICILLVVINHAIMITHIEYIFGNINIENSLSSFRMPLYFTLSGIFFKRYDKMISFLKKKTNNLLIPFLFFYIFGSIFIPLLFQVIGFNMYSDSSFKSLALDCLYNHCNQINGPLWFLLCLFFANILFYYVTYFCNMFFLIFISLSMGIIGLIFSYYRIELPLSIASSFTCLPFFCFGYLVKQLLRDNRYKMKYIPFMFYILVVVFLIYNYSGFVNFSQNCFEFPLTVFPLGILGVIALLMISKAINTLHLVTYIGRYSIIILCTHMFFLRFFHHIASVLSVTNIENFIISLISTIIVCYFITPLFLKYLPYVVAQKNVFSYMESK